jgi:hypothetical protein
VDIILASSRLIAASCFISLMINRMFAVSPTWLRWAGHRHRHRATIARGTGGVLELAIGTVAGIR